MSEKDSSGSVIDRRDVLKITGVSTFGATSNFAQIAAGTSQNGPSVTIRQIVRPDFPDVRIFATVRDDSGNALTNLRKRNFEIYEGGVSQTIDSFTTPDDSGPGNISSGLVIDHSTSMRGGQLTAAKDAAIKFINNFTSDDEGLIIGFGSSINIRQRWNKDTDVLESAINGISLSGSTALYDAIIKGINESAPRVGRSAVIALTDGEENESTASLNEVITTARETGVSVYTIGLGSGVDEAVLKQIANETGGDYYNAPTSSELTNIYNQISQSIQGEYEIVYETTNKATNGNIRDVTLTATNSGNSGSDTGNYEAPCAPLPDAIFNISPSAATVGQEITFDGSASKANGGQLVSYEWDFTNDGLVDASGKTTTHTYSGPGRYEVRLTVKKSCGARDVTTKQIDVTESDFNISVVSTNSPVNAGETLRVEVEIENVTSSAQTANIYLDNLDNSTVDSATFRVGSGETVTTTLTWETDSADADTGQITVRTLQTSAKRQVTVQSAGLRLAGREQKITTAEKIDSRSVLNAIESRFGVTIDGDKEMVESTIDDLRQAVINGELDQQTAEEAIQRMQALEDASLLTVHHVGPKTSDTVGPGADVNIAQATARPTIETAFNLILIVIGVKVSIGSSLGAAGSVALSVATTYLEDAVDKLFSVLLGADSPGPSLKAEANRKCREEAQNLVQQIIDGAIDSGRALLNAIDPIVDELVDLFADGIRATIGLSQVDAALSASALTGNSIGALLGVGPSVYGELQRADQAFGVDKLTSAGLQGSTTTATQELARGRASLDTSINEGMEFLNSLSAFSAEISYWDIFADSLNSDESLPSQLIDIVITTADVLAQGIISVLTSGAAALSGYTLITYLKIMHGRLATAAIKGEEVNYLNV